MNPIIAISMGDYNGIGPEVCLKTLAKSDLNRSIPVWVGSKHVFDFYSGRSGLNLPIRRFPVSGDLSAGSVYIYDPFDPEEIRPEPGKLAQAAGSAAMKAVSAAVDLCLAGRSHAMVTAPISKEAISRAGYSVPGHTEFLAGKTSAPDVVMMLVSRELRVALSTIHIPVREVADSLNRKRLSTQLELMTKSLTNDFGITSPNIAVLALNPHAGDGGVIGDEEIRMIEPVIREKQKTGINVEGPFAADGFFGSARYKQFDATLAMYHDQGLIPFKTLSFGKGVNFTAGLPIIRTSPDHGTAFTIAGKNRADESSFLEAYRLATELAMHRQSQQTQ